MASELKVDKFTGVTTAGSILVTGEGNSNTTNLQQGLAKVWSRYNGTGTAELVDSFNVSSFSDLGTAIGQITYSTNMSTANYNCTAVTGELTGGGNRVIGMSGSNQPPTTSKVAFKSFNTSFAGADQDFNCVTLHGDLA